MNTKEKILAVAEELVLAKGFEKVTLTEIANGVNISQPALYKHFKNKAEVWEELTKTWLDGITANLQPFQPQEGASVAEICHDWLWTLCLDKYTAYQETPAMFALYTQYARNDADIADYHVDKMMTSLSAATGINRLDDLRSLYYLGSRFNHSTFAPYWGTLPDFKNNFEACWKLIAPYFEARENA